MAKRKSLRASICDGVRDAIAQALVATELSGGCPVVTDIWEDGPTGQEWRGPRVRRECERINALLQEFLRKIEQGEVG